ncbi:hypothetical protein D3C73_1153630 [compost metagenome]
MLLKLFHLGSFPFRQHFRQNHIDTNLTSYRSCGSFIISGNHHNLKAKLLKSCNSRFRGILHSVAYTNHPCISSVYSDQENRLPLFFLRCHCSLN